MRVQLGIGLIIAVLLPVALWLFEILKPYGAISAIFLLAGLWILVFGLSFGARGDRLYNIAMGLIIAILSGFYFIPARFALGLIIVAVIALVVISVAVRPKRGSGKVGPAVPTT